MAQVDDNLENLLLAWQVELSRFTVTERRRVLRILRALYNDILNELRNIDPTSSKRHSVRVRRLGFLLEAIAEMLGPAYVEIASGNLAFNTDVARFGRVAIGGGMNAAIGVDIMSISLNEQTLRAIARGTMFENRTTGEWWRNQERSYRVALETELRNGVLRGETVQELTRRVRSVSQLNTRQSESIVRSAAVAVNNQSTIAMYRDNDDIVKGIRWLSTLDSRTTLICRGLSDKRWRFPENRRQGSTQYAEYIPVGHNKRFPGPTAHWACRSTQQSWLKPLNQLTGDTREDIPDSTRAAFGTTVPSSTTQDQWLNRLSRSEQLEILGRSRWELWNAGKLTTTQLTDQFNRPLTVSELEQRYGSVD